MPIPQWEAISPTLGSSNVRPHHTEIGMCWGDSLKGSWGYAVSKFTDRLCLQSLFVSLLELSMNFSIECGIAVSTSPGQSVKPNKALGNWEIILVLLIILGLQQKDLVIFTNEMWGR